MAADSAERARYAYEVDYQAIFHLGARKAAEKLLGERQKAKLERRRKTGARRQRRRQEAAS